MKRAVVLLNMGGPNNLDEVEVFLNNMFNAFSTLVLSYVGVLASQ